MEDTEDTEGRFEIGDWGLGNRSILGLFRVEKLVAEKRFGHRGHRVRVPCRSGFLSADFADLRRWIGLDGMFVGSEPQMNTDEHGLVVRFGWVAPLSRCFERTDFGLDSRNLLVENG